MNTNNNDTGIFVISLDFELYWGVWDVTTKEKYGSNIVGVKEVIPGLIELFAQYDFKVTFATVGFLFCKNKEELQACLPVNRPAYSNKSYDVYKKELPLIGNDEITDPYHFGYSLLELIKESPHEIGTHTFCHYYCLEKGQTAHEFDADIKAAKKIATENNITLSSIVFPRNQINEAYLSVLDDNGIAVYRGNPESWIYKPRKYKAELFFIRICRLLDTYFPVTGNNTYKIKKGQNRPVNIPSSRFLKPYSTHLPAFFEKLKLRRIMNEMTHAAKNNELYHLWWHPHNFGSNLDENLKNLTILLEHYRFLNKEYGFSNLTMKQAGGF